MIPGPFAYHRPNSLAEAAGLLADLGEDARPLAGGHSLIPMMKLREGSAISRASVPTAPTSSSAP